jgi:hypothetical protein
VKRRKQEPAFKTETELCAAFSDWAGREGFVVYPETAEWDLLLVASDGAQIGVEAKLQLNAKVMDQVMRGTRCNWRESPGPDYRAIVVPDQSIPSVADYVMASIGVTVFRPTRSWASRFEQRWEFYRELAHEFEMHDWNPSHRLELPDYVPDVPAGVPGPRTLSPWKVGALRVMAVLEVQGYVTRDNVRECRNDPRRWCATDGWLTQLGGGRWGQGKAPRFDLQHPTIYAQILQETKDKLLKSVDLLGAAITN